MGNIEKVNQKEIVDQLVQKLREYDKHFFSRPAKISIVEDGNSSSITRFEMGILNDEYTVNAKNLINYLNKKSKEDYDAILTELSAHEVRHRIQVRGDIDISWWLSLDSNNAGDLHEKLALQRFEVLKYELKIAYPNDGKWLDELDAFMVENIAYVEAVWKTFDVEVIGYSPEKLWNEKFKKYFRP